MNEQEWREFCKEPSSISTIESKEWLKAGCPKCGCKKWQVTDDHYAYCMDCNKGYHTAYRFTERDILEELDYSTHPAEEKKPEERNCGNCGAKCDRSLEGFAMWKDCYEYSNWQPKPLPSWEKERERILGEFDAKKELQECGWRCRGCDGFDARKCKFHNRDMAIKEFIIKALDLAYNLGRGKGER